MVNTLERDTDNNNAAVAIVARRQLGESDSSGSGRTVHPGKFPVSADD